MSILEQVRRDVDAAKAAGTTTGAKEERKATQFWVNVGITLKGAGENGADLFVSLPMGIALDDIKPVNVRGNNVNYVQLQQAKNALLNATQTAAAKLAPGERMPLPEFSVEIARVSAPDQVGDTQSNPLLGALANALGG